MGLTSKKIAIYHDQFEDVIDKTVKVDFVKLTESQRDAKRAEEAAKEEEEEQEGEP